MSFELEKYKNALSNLSGLEFPYKQGGPDVKVICELMCLAFIQDIFIGVFRAEIERFRNEIEKN